MTRELSVSQLRRTIDPASLGIHSTADVAPLEGVIGQERAVQALQFGVGMRNSGFNLFVAGPPGIGKMSAIKSFLETLAKSQPRPNDLCYVNNFDDPYQPLALVLPAGKGRQLQAEMKSLVEQVRRRLPTAFESEEYIVKRDELLNQLNFQRNEVFNSLNAKAAEVGFALQITPAGIMTVPQHEGQSLTEEQFEALERSEREAWQARHEVFQPNIRQAMKQIRDLERAINEKLHVLDRQVALYVVGGLMEDIIEKFANGELEEVKPVPEKVVPEKQVPEKQVPEKMGGKQGSRESTVINYLKSVQKDLLENITLFRTGLTPSSSAPSSSAAGQLAGNEAALVAPWLQELPFRKYAVNVLIDNSTQIGAPVIVEQNPTHIHLFGRVEKESQFGALYTDFTMIKAGSFHQAGGGYLVLPIEDLLREYYSWDTLKRSLRSGHASIEELSDRLGFVTTKTLRPQPIPLNVKVLLVGRPQLYQLLHAYDPDFAELFKVRVDFDTEMKVSDDNIGNVVAFLSMICQREGYLHLDALAVARLLEHAMRLADDQTKLSTHFGLLADIVREANYWTEADKATAIQVEHVRKALDQRIYRSSMIRERLQEMIARNMLMIDTDGSAIGQINGLSVINLGDYMFGQPGRITVSVEPGSKGVIDIQREVEMGGPIHSKGVMILGGYLSHQFGQERPLTLSARLVFEQNYEGIEGDSASSTELYALLSALSRTPIRQGLAVTGSVNQRGAVQVIGGVNEKIEGFFDVCTARGLTGEQGVLIPVGNVDNLMLREDVVEAVRVGRFHIWPVAHINEGIELLTGESASTIHERINGRLDEFGKRLKEFASKETTNSVTSIPHTGTS